MSFLSGQRVLLIAPRFFGYELDIMNELERQGARVDWLPDRPFDTPIMTALTKVLPGIVMPGVDRLYEKLLIGFGATHYDLVLIVNGQTVSCKTVRRLRVSFPRAKFVLYLWDSIANRAHVRDNLRQFDRVCTFDPKDSSTYQLSLRPLFYGHGFNAVSPSLTATLYQISFVGTAHTDRFAVVDRLQASLPRETRTYWYLYLQAQWVLYYYRLTKPHMRHARVDDFEFTPLNKVRLNSIFADSHAILDIEHPLQVGLTMRTFETLGARKKLVTTNASVRDYDFFSSNNICVIERANPLVPDHFLDSPFTPLSDEVRNRYSISGWLAELLEHKHY